MLYNPGASPRTAASCLKNDVEHGWQARLTGGFLKI